MTKGQKVYQIKEECDACGIMAYCVDQLCEDCYVEMNDSLPARSIVVGRIMARQFPVDPNPWL